MQSNFDRAMPHILAYEGGYVDHPKDPGGATNLGITRKVLAEWRGITPYTRLPKTEVAALSLEEAKAIYKARYWKPVRGDDLPPGIDLSVFDAGVNSGPSRSVKWLQSALGVPADGVVGDRQTMPALRKADIPKTIKGHCAKRLGFMRSLAIWNTFGKGWSARVAKVEATALSWVLSKAEMEAEAKKAKDVTTAQTGGAVVVGGGGGLSIPSVEGIPWWAVALAIGAVLAVLTIRIIINMQRANALSDAAKEAV